MKTKANVSKQGGAVEAPAGIEGYVQALMKQDVARQPLRYEDLMTQDRNGRWRTKPGIRAALTKRDATGRRVVDVKNLAQLGQGSA